MEGKTVVMAVLLLSLVVGQIQVEAKSCCPSTSARNIYNICRLKASRATCGKISGCKFVDKPPCPGDFDHDILQKTGKINSFLLLCFLSLLAATDFILIQ